MAEPAHTITLRLEGAGFVVAVDPPHDEHPPRRFADHRQARGWAGGLRLIHKWPLIDQAGDQPGKGR